MVFGLSQNKALFKAVERNDVAKLEKILGGGYNANIRRSAHNHESPLEVACRMGHVQCVQVLLKHKARPDKMSESHGATLLHLASHASRTKAEPGAHDQIVRILIEAKVDVNKQNVSGYSALHWAAHEGFHQTVQILISAGADPDLQNVNGSTALHLASANGRQLCIDELLKGGARLDIENNYEKLPLFSGSAQAPRRTSVDRKLGRTKFEVFVAPVAGSQGDHSKLRDVVGECQLYVARFEGFAIKELDIRLSHGRGTIRRPLYLMTRAVSRKDFLGHGMHRLFFHFAKNDLISFVQKRKVKKFDTFKLQARLVTTTSALGRKRVVTSNKFSLGLDPDIAQHPDPVAESPKRRLFGKKPKPVRPALLPVMNIVQPGWLQLKIERAFSLPVAGITSSANPFAVVHLLDAEGNYVLHDIWKTRVHKSTFNPAFLHTFRTTSNHCDVSAVHKIEVFIFDRNRLSKHACLFRSSIVRGTDFNGVAKGNMKNTMGSGYVSWSLEFEPGAVQVAGDLQVAKSAFGHSETEYKDEQGTDTIMGDVEVSRLDADIVDDGLVEEELEVGDAVDDGGDATDGGEVMRTRSVSAFSRAVVSRTQSGISDDGLSRTSTANGGGDTGVLFPAFDDAQAALRPAAVHDDEEAGDTVADALLPMRRASLAGAAAEQEEASAATRPNPLRRQKSTLRAMKLKALVNELAADEEAD